MTKNYTLHHNNNNNNGKKWNEHVGGERRQIFNTQQKYYS